MKHQPTEHEMETVTGQYVDLVNPKPKTIRIFDIAHHTAQTCRYGGSTAVFYSVAEHAVLCVSLAKRQGYGVLGQIACLHHDSSEAYLGDQIQPRKGLWANFKELEVRMDVAILEALELPLKNERVFHSEPVKLVDMMALAIETRQLLPSKGEGWGVQQSYNKIFTDNGRMRMLIDQEVRLGLSPNAAREAFVKKHIELMEAWKNER